MSKNRRTFLIYLVDEKMEATKLEGDAAWVYTQIVTEALELLKVQSPEKFKIFAKLESTRVRLLRRVVTGKEFDEITKKEEEDQA